MLDHEQSMFLIFSLDSTSAHPLLRYAVHIRYINAVRYDVMGV